MLGHQDRWPSRANHGTRPVQGYPSSIWQRLYGNVRGMDDILVDASGQLAFINRGVPRSPPSTKDAVHDISGGLYGYSQAEHRPEDSRAQFGTSVYSTTVAPLATIVDVKTAANLSDVDVYGPWNRSRLALPPGTECDDQLASITQYTYLYGLGLLILLALVLNTISLILFRSKPVRNYAFSVYLSVLSVVDTLSLLSHVPRQWLGMLYKAAGWDPSTTFYEQSTYACKSVTFLAFVVRFMSSWLVVAAISERLTITSHPYSTRRLRTVRGAKQALLYVSVSALLLNLYALVVWKSAAVPPPLGGPIRHSCIPVSPSPMVSVAVPIASVASIVGLPLILSAVLTAATVHNFSSWRVRPRKLSSNAICRALLEKQATVMVCALATVFASLCVPYAIIWTLFLLQHFVFEPTLCQMIQLAAARDIAEVFFMINYCIKLLVCILTGRSVLNQGK